MPVKDLEELFTLIAILLLHQGNSPYPRKTLLSNLDYERYVEAHAEDIGFFC